MSVELACTALTGSRGRQSELHARTLVSALPTGRRCRGCHGMRPGAFCHVRGSHRGALGLGCSWFSAGRTRQNPNRRAGCSSDLQGPDARKWKQSGLVCLQGSIGGSDPHSQLESMGWTRVGEPGDPRFKPC